MTHAKPIMLEVMHEAYISNQLEEAMIIGTKSLIIDALKQAESAKMYVLNKVHKNMNKYINEVYEYASNTLYLFN